MSRRAFTLLELLVVMAIMAMMTTATISSYRAMRQGMEQSSVLRNASQFVRIAYQRSQIDRVPVNVYFWNETRSVEDASKDTKLSVAGRAVAVRRQGYFTSVKGSGKGQLLLDEFGDLDVHYPKDKEGRRDSEYDGYDEESGMYLYKMKNKQGEESNFHRSQVCSFSKDWKEENIRLMSNPDWEPVDSSQEGTSITSYGYYVQDAGGVTWHKGDAYGVEFGDFELPERYLFGKTYSDSLSSAVKVVKLMSFNPFAGNANQTIEVSALRPNEQGELAALSIGETTAPDKKMSEQNKQ